MSEHIPVMLSEVLIGLNIKPKGIYLDATFGRGGHSRAILSALGPEGQLFALDQDLDAVNYANQHIKDARFKIVHGSFSNLSTLVEDLGIKGRLAGILMDIGVSSPQLDESQRGFSFMKEGPLDMRMNTTVGITAADYVNTASEEAMTKIFYEYGEERFSKRIAQAIIKARQEKLFETTTQLAEVIKLAQPRMDMHKHPATRVFQALRIEVNQELTCLKSALNASVDALEIGGRLAVISFHSLEDRIVKLFMLHQEKGPELPPHLPIPSHLAYEPRFKRIGKAIKPSEQELVVNPRSRSAILRVGERIS